jgi:hypothetical protein
MREKIWNVGIFIGKDSVKIVARETDTYLSVHG